jgi:toxin ParE1/3/4
VKSPTPELSGYARRDLDEIRDWTIKTWGREQWQTYYRGLGAAFRQIATDPNCGQTRNLLGKGIRSLAFERHLIFFAPVTSFKGQTVILRILHQRRNLTAVTYLDDLEG